MFYICDHKLGNRTINPNLKGSLKSMHLNVVAYAILSGYCYRNFIIFLQHYEGNLQKLNLNGRVGKFKIWGSILYLHSTYWITTESFTLFQIKKNHNYPFGICSTKTKPVEGVVSGGFMCVVFSWDFYLQPTELIRQANVVLVEFFQLSSK